jgi:hypothetical protein
MRRRSSPYIAAPVVLLVLLTAGCNAVRYALPALGGLDERRLVLSLPPVDLPAGADEHHMGPQPPAELVASPVEGWLRGFSVDLVDADGDSVPGEVLHHMKVLLPSRRELFMPIALRAAGAGSETRHARLRGALGMPIGRGDTLLLTAMLHNPTGRDLKGVQVRVTLYYSPSSTGRIATVYPFFLHVTPPGEPSSFDLPPGYSERSWEAESSVGGEILGLGGHLHRYGVRLRLTDVTTGRELWQTAARRDADGNILEIPRTRYVWSRGIRIQPGHVYRVTAAYLNPTDHVIPGGGMGTIGGVIRPEGTWPRVDRTAPLYVWDLDRERSGDMGMDTDLEMPETGGHAGHTPGHRP